MYFHLAKICSLNSVGQGKKELAEVSKKDVGLLKSFVVVVVVIRVVGVVGKFIKRNVLFNGNFGNLLK